MLQIELWFVLKSLLSYKLLSGVVLPGAVLPPDTFRKPLVLLLWNLLARFFQVNHNTCQSNFHCLPKSAHSLLYDRVWYL